MAASDRQLRPTRYKAGAREAKMEEKRLLELFGRLAPGQQDELMALAELLASDATHAERVDLPRREGETVVMAIRRLARSYPMLERRKLMGEASRLMAQHALEGRDASAVIDELEAVFARHYEKIKGDK